MYRTTRLRHFEINLSCIIVKVRSVLEAESHCEVRRGIRRGHKRSACSLSFLFYNTREASMILRERRSNACSYGV